jgi:hypothetical protein
LDVDSRIIVRNFGPNKADFTLLIRFARSLYRPGRRVGAEVKVEDARSFPRRGRTTRRLPMDQRGYFRIVGHAFATAAFALILMVDDPARA